jgi:putative iron-regulated protein
MKKVSMLLAATALLAVSSCNKKDDVTSEEDFQTMKTTVLKDFTNNIALNNYSDLNKAAQSLYTSLNALNADASEANLEQARKDWKSMRAIWEQAEGFLFGPVEDNNYDPNMDTWPTDFSQMDSLLASSNALTPADISTMPLSLRGYHPIEYIIFGADGKRSAASITARQKTYMLSLATDLKQTCQSLYTEWSAAPTNYALEVTSAGNGSKIYAKKNEVYIALVDGMAGICEEVGTGKMAEPYTAKDSAIVESPYSGTSMIDFKNNIIGLQNVYMGRYGSHSGKGIHDLVAAKNKSLDNTIQTQIAAAISSFDNVTVSFEQAIFTQRVQVKNVMDALATLQSTLEDDLKPFVVEFITE